MKTYASLHTHSHFSLLDSIIKPDIAFKKCKDLGVTALAITDHGSMGGIVTCASLAKEHKIKWICGCEVYLSVNDHTSKDTLEVIDPAEGKKKKSNYHLTLLAYNLEGYKNLCRMSYTAHVEGFYYKPRVSFEELSRHSEGLICLSGCLAGEANTACLTGGESAAKRILEKYLNVFGKNFYVEIQDHGIDLQKSNNAILTHLAEEMNIPIVATTDAHFIEQSNKHLHDCIMCIQTHNSLSNPDRFSLPENCYMKSAEEMETEYGHINGAINNSLLIAEQCEFNLFDYISDKKPIFPEAKLELDPMWKEFNDSLGPRE